MFTKTKKRLLSVLFASALLVAAGSGAMESRNSNIALNDLAIANIEALARDENPGEKIYRYTVSSHDCWIYVGSAYAKGKEVTCWPGDEHPVCVSCQL